MSRTRFICKCECGDSVRGVQEFGRLFTWCTKCTPVVKVSIKKIEGIIERTVDKIKRRKGKK